MIDARSNGLNIGLRHRKPYKVITCMMILMAFFINIFAYDMSSAAGSSSELAIIGSDRIVKPDFKKLNAGTFAIPEYLGHIKEAYIGTSGRTIVQIQDAHCNYEAQEKVAQIIEYLSAEYGIKTVNLEGGAKDYDLSIFTSILDKDARKRTSAYFMNEGLISGAEYFAVNNPEKVSLWGIEDPTLYLENLNVYRNSLRHKDEIGKSLKSLGYILTSLKIKIYSKDLLKFDTRYSQYKANNIELKEYLSFLIDESKARSVDMKEYINIDTLCRVLIEESKIDFKKADNERDVLIDALHKKLSKNSAEEFSIKTVEFKSGKISQKAFYGYILRTADKLRLDLKEYPELIKYVAYITMYGSVDKMKITDEIENLETRIKDSIFENQAQRDLARLSKDLAITKNIFNISLTRDDYRYYRSNEDAFDVLNYVRFIEANAPKYSVAAKLDDNIADLDRYRDDIIKFYEYSFERDEAFVKNMRYTIDHRPETEAAILITGGFHTDNLCDMFRSEGTSYVSIIPSFTNEEGYKSPYFNLLSGEPTPIEKAILPYISAMQVPSYLSPIKGAISEAGLVAFEADVYIRGMIEQGESFKIIQNNGVDIQGLDFIKGDGQSESITISELLTRIKQVHAVTGVLPLGNEKARPTAVVSGSREFRGVTTEEEMSAEEKILLEAVAANEFNSTILLAVEIFCVEMRKNVVKASASAILANKYKERFNDLRDKPKLTDEDRNAILRALAEGAQNTFVRLEYSVSRDRISVSISNTGLTPILNDRIEAKLSSEPDYSDQVQYEKLDPRFWIFGAGLGLTMLKPTIINAGGELKFESVLTSDPSTSIAKFTINIDRQPEAEPPPERVKVPTNASLAYDRLLEERNSALETIATDSPGSLAPSIAKSTAQMSVKDIVRELKGEITKQVIAKGCDIKEVPAVNGDEGGSVMLIKSNMNGTVNSTASVEKLVRIIEDLIKGAGKFNAVITRVRLYDTDGHGIYVTTGTETVNLSMEEDNNCTVIGVMYMGVPVFKLQISNKVVGQVVAEKEEAAVMPPATGSNIDSMNSRAEALAHVSRVIASKDSIVKVVVGVPGGANANKSGNLAMDLGKTLAEKGFSILSLDKESQSQVGDRKQIVPFAIDADPEITKANYIAAMDKALRETESGKGYVVSFAPQMEGGAQLAKQYESVPGQVTIVPDAYTDYDHDTDSGKWPDIMARVGLARCIVLYNMDIDKQAIWDTIKTLLGKISTNDLSNVKDLEGLLANLRLFALAIKPIDYNKDMVEWGRNQRAMATSL